MLADEQLSGPARELAEGRLTAWLGTHIATLLKPLIDIGQDQLVTGMARGIAFRLVENLGILERREVAEDVRGLDQEARAGLRRHGVRFGSHHIYFPALLKPGPSTLAGAALGPQAPRSRCAGTGGAAGDLRIGPHVGRRRPELRSRGLPALRLPCLRAARRAHRHPGAAGRPHPAGHRLASRCDGRAARGRRARGSRLRHYAADDVAARLVRRRFRHHPQGPRLSHGAAAEAEGGAEPAEPARRNRRARCGGQCSRRAPQPGEPTPEPPPSEELPSIGLPRGQCSRRRPATRRADS